MNWQAADRAATEAIAARHAERARSILVGLAGAQGSGKTTMAPRVAALLADRGLRTATLALDDFYLTRRARQVLAREVHPLLATRGVPGTHDLALLDTAIANLLAGRSAAVPQFDKAADDRAGAIDMRGPFDVVMLEGWCIGARPQAPGDLALPMNALERDEDRDTRWRTWVNDRLAGEYAGLFARLDLRILLRAPDFAVVARWRGEQEAHLGTRAMPQAALVRFVAHYERITRGMLDSLPADLVIDLDANRQPAGTREYPAR